MSRSRRLCALVRYHAMFSPEHLRDEQAEHAIELLLRGAAADYPALLAHSRKLYPAHFEPGGMRHTPESSSCVFQHTRNSPGRDQLLPVQGDSVRDQHIRGLWNVIDQYFADEFPATDVIFADSDMFWFLNRAHEGGLLRSERP